MLIIDVLYDVTGPTAMGIDDLASASRAGTRSTRGGRTVIT
jgi:hypothetical protein